jgi:hypothetical protein
MPRPQVRTSDSGHNLQQPSMPPMATSMGLGRTTLAFMGEVPYIVVSLGPSEPAMGPSQDAVPQHADMLPVDPAYPTIHPLQTIPRTVTTMPAGSAQHPRWGDNDLQQPPPHAFSLPTGAAALPPFAPPHLFPNHNYQHDPHLLAPAATNGTASNGTAANGHHQHHLPMEGSLEFNPLLLALLENTRGGSSTSLVLDEQHLHQEPAGPAGAAGPAAAAAHVRPSSPVLPIAPGSTQLPSNYPELASRGFDPLQQQLRGFLPLPAADAPAGPAAAGGPLESPYANPPSWAVDDLADAAAAAAAAGPAAGTKKKRNLKEFSSPFLASGRPSGTSAASDPASGGHEARQQPDQLPARSPNTSPSQAHAAPPPSSNSLGDIEGARRLLRLASNRSGRNRMVLVDPDAGLMDLDIFDLSGNPIEVESLGSAGAMSLSMEDPFRPSGHSLGHLAPVYEGFPTPSELLVPSHLLDQALASGPVAAGPAPAAVSPEPAEQQLLETFQSLDLKAGAEEGPAVGAPGARMEPASSLAGALDAFASGPVGYDFNGLQAPSFDLSSLLRQETRRAYNRSLSKSMAFGEDGHQQQQQDGHAAAAAGGGSREAAQPAVLSPGAQQLEHHAMVDEGMQEDGLDFFTDMDRAAMTVGGVLEADMRTLEQRSTRSGPPVQIMHPHTQAFALLPMHLVQGDGMGSPEELLAGMTYKMQHADGLPEGVVVVHGRQKRQKMAHRCASVKWVSEEQAS